MTRRIVLGGFLLIVAGLAGCLGRNVPPERFLRLTQPEACAQASAGSPVRVVALRGISSLPSLDQRSVLFMDQGVLTASPDLSWEGPPSGLVDQYLEAALGCDGNLRTIRPFTPRGGQDLALSGRLLAFEVRRTPEWTFVASMRLTLTDGSGRELLGTMTFEASEPLSATDGRHIAAAAATVMAVIGDQARNWVETGR